MMLLHARLQAGEFPNCRQVAHDLEVSAKTIQRDIDFMRDRLGLPIEYEPLRFGFRYTEPVAGFPTVEVSEGEIAALFVAQKALAQYKGTPYEAPLRSAFRKITEGLRERVSFSWSDLDDVISFRSAGASVADLELFERVSKAILRSVAIECEYRGLKSKRYEPRSLRPYHLACLDNQWYLFAEDSARAELRTFALPRMRHVELTEKRFERPTDFSVTEVLRGSFGVFSGTRKYRIALEFDQFAARLVGERIWHESQQLRQRANGGVVLELELGGLEEIERWILGWGEHVRVLRPAVLAQQITERTRAVLRLYAHKGKVSFASGPASRQPSPRPRRESRNSRADRRLRSKTR